MKKNGNEIKLLTFLIALMIFYSFYAFLIKPQWDSSKALKAQVEQEDLLVREMYNNILKYNENVEEIKSISGYIVEKSKDFYVDAKQEEIIDQIDNWLADSELKHNSIQFENPSYYNIKYVKEDGTEITDIQNIIPEETDDKQEFVKRDYDIVLENSGYGTEGQELDLDPVLWNTVTIEATGKRFNVEKLLNELAKFDKKTISSEFRFEVTPESFEENYADGDVKISIQISFLNILNPNLAEKNSDSVYEIPEMPASYVVPVNFLSGAYLHPFSFEFIKNLFD